MSNKNEKVTLRDDGEGGGGRSSSDGGVEGGGIDVRLEGDIEDAKLDSGVDASISVDNVSIEHTRLHMENTRLEDGVQTLTDLSSGKLPAVDGERLDTVSDGRLGTIDDTRLSAVDSERLNSVGGDVGGEAQAITITIMDPGSLDPSALDPGTLGGALVTTVEAQSEDATGFMVPVNDDGTIVVQGDEGLHSMNDVSIALINSASDNSVTSLNQVPDRERTSSIIKANNSSLSRRKDVLRKDFVSVSAAEEDDDEEEEEIGRHCFVCNIELPTENEDDSVSVFKTQTTSSLRKVSVILSSLVGQTLTARKAHSDIMCRRCFSLLDRVDTLEVEIKTSKEEIVTKFQNTIALYGGRARKRKPTAAVRRDFVFPKVEPDDDYEAKELDMGDDTFEPTVDDLMQEEADERDDDNLLDVGVTEGDDAEWEPQTKRPRVKKEPVEIADPNAPPKRKRGRPRKGTTPVKAKVEGEGGEGEVDGTPACPVCPLRFRYVSQLRRHIRHQHPGSSVPSFALKCEGVADNPTDDAYYDDDEEATEAGGGKGVSVSYDLRCPWCSETGASKEDYDAHLQTHLSASYERYLSAVNNLATFILPSAGSEDRGQEGHPDEEVPRKEDPEEEQEKEEQQQQQQEQVVVTCKLCMLDVENRAEYEKHLDVVHGELARVCVLCRVRCLDRDSLKAHVVHHFEGYLTCPVCPVRFSVRSHLTMHLNYHHIAQEHLEEELPCPYCHHVSRTVKECVSHLEQHDHQRIKQEVEEYDQGEEAGKGRGTTVSDPSAASRPHCCKMCPLRFSFNTQLYRHVYDHHPEVYSYKCDECERRFRLERTFLSHKWGHRYGRHQCPACRLKYRRVEQLRQHLQTSHPELDGICCEFCPLDFKNYATYTAHLKLKHPREAGYYTSTVKCQTCGEKFSHKAQLKYHMRAHNRSEAQTCEICGVTVRYLSQHMNLHTQEKKYECHECGAVYHTKPSYQFHVKRVHQGSTARKHLCDMCGKKFLTPADLRIHESRVHRGERNYWCGMCNKGYKSKVSLTYHMRLHTGERPHTCHMCGKTFRIPSYLKRHVEHIHRTRYQGVYFKGQRDKRVPSEPRVSSRGSGNSSSRRKVTRHQQFQVQQHQEYHQEDAQQHVVETEGALAADIPEMVQITVPVEVGGKEEIVWAVKEAQPEMEDVDVARDFVEDGVVYVVYEN